MWVVEWEGQQLFLKWRNGMQPTAARVVVGFIVTISHFFLRIGNRSINENIQGCRNKKGGAHSLKIQTGRFSCIHTLKKKSVL